MSWVIKKPSHLEGSFEYPQQMFWLRNKKSFFSHELLIKGLILDQNRKREGL